METLRTGKFKSHLESVGGIRVGGASLTAAVNEEDRHGSDRLFRPGRCLIAEEALVNG